MATGLTSALSAALARPDVIHDRGAVFRDMAVAIADGGTHICDLAVLGNQQRVFGPIALDVHDVGVRSTRSTRTH